MSQRMYIQQGPRRAAHTANSRLLPRLLAAGFCLLIATVLGGGAWHFFDVREQAVSDRAVEQAALYRAVHVTQTLSKPVVASTARVTPTILASGREHEVVVSKVAVSDAALAKNKPNIANEVEGVEKSTAARLSATTN